MKKNNFTSCRCFNILSLLNLKQNQIEIMIFSAHGVRMGWLQIKWKKLIKFWETFTIIIIIINIIIICRELNVVKMEHDVFLSW